MNAMKAARDIVPYSDFGERVIAQSIGEQFLSEPIRHGVDIDKFHPVETSKEDVFGVERTRSFGEYSRTMLDRDGNRLDTYGLLPNSIQKNQTRCCISTLIKISLTPLLILIP